MRLRPGRPDIARHSHRFSVPVAESDAPLTVTWLGVSTLLLDDGSSALMTDGFFSRPSLARVGLSKVSPSAARVDGCLARLNVKRLEAVIPVHTHFDHVLDSALVADRTGALLVGGESAANVGRGHGIAEDRLVIAESGTPIQLGAFDITLVESRHSPPDRFPGEITEPVIPPVKVAAYRCGKAWSTFVHHRSSGRRLLIQGSAGFVKGSLAGQRAGWVCSRSPISSTTGQRRCGPSAHAGRSWSTGTISSGRCQSRCGPCRMWPMTWMYRCAS
jgi:L-ascorbate metabolism protein UlaG (beta-lactamase superfamily)